MSDCMLWDAARILNHCEWISFDDGGKSHQRVGPPRSFSHDLGHLLGILRKIESRYETPRLTIVASYDRRLLCKSFSRSCNRTFRHSPGYGISLLQNIV